MAHATSVAAHMQLNLSHLLEFKCLENLKEWQEKRLKLKAPKTASVSSPLSLKPEVTMVAITHEGYQVLLII